MKRLPPLKPPNEARSRNMAAIRSGDTKIELLVRKALHSSGFRFRLHNKHLPGRPDVVLARFKTVVFVHGCFWHGHICKEARRPKSNLRYWTPKIEGNMARDARVQAETKAMGWKIVVIRECTVRNDTRKLVRTLRKRRAIDA